MRFNNRDNFINGEGKMRSIFKLMAAATIASTIVGCSSIAASTNMLSDSDLLSKSAGGLGYSPSDLQILDKRVSGTDTYATLRARDGKEYTCIINGGNLLSFGMTNPAICQPRR